ncbi:hypothetical protein B5F14_01770 [Faecalitalea cylindroides]|uniref:Uncharacterized protein n=1 Tax=Faecalitalea cylindroides TaxID=39483 RepID=A0A1Y4M0L5_9FIRM|nr:hypothetical protein [Faecalitalea cylindroides]OUP61710.1 hypothetical protein B5F14_01770 [Faecalitalea cylindroides]
MLTKEECINALENIIFNVGVARSDYRTSGKAKEDYCTLNSLIEEHFSNPPLKFEELQERETYYHIYYGWISIRSISDCECILINTLNSDGYKQIEFEEDCFYKKEVQV